MADSTFTPSITGPNAAIVPQPTVPGGRLDVNAVDQQLTLANGMTAGYGVFDNHNDNWPLGYPGAPNHYGSWRLQPKRVGYLRNITGAGVPTTPSNPTGQYVLYFMYNPNEIDVTWAMSQGGYSSLYLYGSNTSDAFSSVASGQSQSQAPIPAFANQQSVSWTLYFDRTYDMMYGTDGAGAGAEDDRGVLKDIAALYNLMGTFTTNAAVPISVPCRVVFGQNKDGQLWGFTGMISSSSISYGVFRHDMIPSMAEVQLTMTCTYVGTQAPPASDPPTGAASVNQQFQVKPGEIPFQWQGPPPTVPGKSPTNPSGLPGSQLNPVTSQPGAKTPVSPKLIPPLTGPGSALGI